MTTPTILVNTSLDVIDGSAAEGWKIRFQLSNTVAVSGASGTIVAGDFEDVIVDADGDQQISLFRNKAVDDGNYYIVSLLKPNTKNWINAGFVEFEDVAGPVNLQDVIVTQDPGTLTAAQAAVITANAAADRAEAAAASVSLEVADFAALDALTTGVEVGESVRVQDRDQLYTRVNSGGDITTTGGLSFDEIMPKLRKPTMEDFLSSSDVSRAGVRWLVDTGEVLDVVASGAGDYDHPTTGMGVLAVPALGKFTFAQFGGFPTNTAAENNTAWNYVASAVSRVGGATVVVDNGTYEQDQPVTMVDGMHLKLCPSTVLKNTLSPYNFVNSAIFSPGNFHSQFTENFYGHADTHSIANADAGASDVELSVPAEASNYSAGDTVWVFSDSFFVSSFGFKIPEYAVLAKVVSVSGSTLALNRTLTEDLSGYIHNVTTTVVTGADGGPLRACCNSSVDGGALETQGYWIADSATLDCSFSNIRTVNTRSVVYGNTYQRTRFENIAGDWTTTPLELSHNSDDVTVKSCQFDWREVSGLPASYGVSTRENSRAIKLRDLTVGYGGFTGSQVGLYLLNASGVDVDGITMRGAPSGYTGSVVFVGDDAGSGRVAPTGNRIRNISWLGNFGRGVLVQDTISSVTDDLLVEDCAFVGTCSTGEAMRISGNTGTNQYRNLTFSDGRLFLASGVSGQTVDRCYFEDGLALLAASDEILWRNNTIRNVKTSKSASRGLADFVEASAPAHTGTTTETDIISIDLGASPFELLDELSVRLRVFTNATGTKSVTVKLFDGSSDIDIYDWSLPASSVTGYLDLSAAYMAPNNMVVTGIEAEGSALVPINSVITSGLTGSLTLKVSATLADASGTIQFREIRTNLKNPLIN